MTDVVIAARDFVISIEDPIAPCPGCGALVLTMPLDVSMAIDAPSVCAACGAVLAQT